MIFSDDDVKELAASFARELRLAEGQVTEVGELRLSDEERKALKATVVLESNRQFELIIARIFITQRKITKCEVPHNDHLAYARDVKTCLSCGKTCCKMHALKNCPHCGSHL